LTRLVVAIGDSITYGQHLPAIRAWPHQIVDPHPIVAFGVPGDTTRQGLERFPRDVQDICPEIAIIQFGHNDCNRWETDRGLPRVSLAAYKANLIEMVDRCRKFDIRPLLCSLTPSFRSTEHAADVMTYDQTLRRVADDESVPLADVRKAFQIETPLLMDDGLHLNEEGHRVYASVVQEALKRMAG
jgi:lysophospholipase L1-like esterase